MNFKEESMKRFFTVAAPCVALFFLLLSSSPAQTPSGPSMVLPEKSFDFSEVEEGKVVEHAFRVLNNGQQPLQIKNVNPG